MEAAAPDQVPEIVYDSGIDAPGDDGLSGQYPDVLRGPLHAAGGRSRSEAIRRLYAGAITPAHGAA